MSVKGTFYSRNTLISLKERVMLSKKNSSTQTYCSSWKKTAPSYIKNKGSGTTSFSLRQSKSRKGISKTSASYDNCDDNVDDYHHNCAGNQQFDNRNNPSFFPSEESSVEIDIPFVDTTAIKSFIIGIPQIIFTGKGNVHSINCVRVCDGLRVTKTFETLKMLQGFLKSEAAKAWLRKGNRKCNSNSDVTAIETGVDVCSSEEGNEGNSKRGLDYLSSVKRMKHDVVTSTVKPVTAGILKISFIEKCNAYKIDYICPCDGQRVMKTFEKFSMLQAFLQSGDVRACLMGMIENSKIRSKMFSEENSRIGRNDVSRRFVPVNSITGNIKVEVEDSDVGLLSSDFPNMLPIKKHEQQVSLLQTFSPSYESKASLKVASENNSGDMELSADMGTISSNEDIDEPNNTNRIDCFGEEHFSSNPNGEVNVEGQCVSKGGRYGIDTTAIKPLIAGYPKICYRKKFEAYRIVCIRACDGQRVTTSFRNLSTLQTFLNSDDAKAWLMDELEPRGRNYKSKSCPVTYDRELLAIKPEICFLKPDRLRLLCIPKCGRPKTKFFRCSDQGKNDLNAMQKVKDFLTSQGFISWITAERRCDNTGKGVDSLWILKDTVRTGADMRLYIDELLDFDCTKTVDVNSAVGLYLNIHHNPEVPSFSHAQNPGWGRVHRSDDTFTLKDNAPPDLFRRTYRIVSVSVRCSSRSNMCRTACGELLTNCKIIGSHFSCCNEPLPAHNECNHCKSTTSSYDKWHKMTDGILCRVCYNYLRKRKTPRPLNPKKIPPKPFYTHNQCQYRLRLELMPDLQHWQVYYHSANKQEHDDATAVGCKRFTLTERDFIDKVRSSAGRVTAKQIGISYRSVKQETSSHPLKQYQSRCKVVDTHILDSTSMEVEAMEMETTEEQITIRTDWRTIESHDTFDNEVECIEFEINDTEPEFTLNSTVPTVVETKPNFEWNTEVHAKSSPPKKPIKTEDPLIICFKCVMDPNRKDNPFSCNDSKDLESHIKMSHKENLICCSICFQQGAVESFPSLRLLNHHVRQFHSKEKACKKAETSLQN